jgi:hypothetical protein
MGPSIGFTEEAVALSESFDSVFVFDTCDIASKDCCDEFIVVPSAFPADNFTAAFDSASAFVFFAISVPLVLPAVGLLPEDDIASIRVREFPLFRLFASSGDTPSSILMRFRSSRCSLFVPYDEPHRFRMPVDEEELSVVLMRTGSRPSISVIDLGA